MLLAALLLAGCPQAEQVDPEADSANRQADEPICLPDGIIACLVEVAQIQYVADTKGHDVWQTPAETARLGQGDCEDLAIFFQDLMRRKGYDVDVVFGLEHRWADHGHCWCEMAVDGERYVVEPGYAMFLPRKKLPKVMYMVAEDIDVVAEKVRAYHERTGVCVSEGYRSAVGGR
jgi:transglutaminase-like putative cysteine protease